MPFADLALLCVFTILTSDSSGTLYGQKWKSVGSFNPKVGYTSASADKWHAACPVSVSDR